MSKIDFEDMPTALDADGRICGELWQFYTVVPIGFDAAKIKREALQQIADSEWYRPVYGSAFIARLFGREIYEREVRANAEAEAILARVHLVDGDTYLLKSFLSETGFAWNEWKRKWIRR